MNVVMVLDDERVLRPIQYELMVAGYDVAAFSHFEPAKRYLTLNGPDVLVTDLRLGAFNGLQLVLIAKSRRPQTAAFVFSRFDDPVLRQDAAAIGASFRMKPIESDRLLREIARLRTPSVAPFPRLRLQVC